MKKLILNNLYLAAFSVVVAACNGDGGSSNNGQPSNLNQQPSSNSAAASSTVKSVNPNNSQPKIIGYYTNWSTYDAGYTPDKIPAAVNQVYYAFMQVGGCNPAIPANELDPAQCQSQMNYNNTIKIQPGVQDYKLHTTDAWSDFNVYNVDSSGDHVAAGGTNIGGLGNISKALKTGKPVVLSIGGWTLSAAIRPAITPNHVNGFVTSIIDFMQQAEHDSGGAKLAGVDVDWEPNGNYWSMPSNNPSLYVSLSKEDLENYLQFLTKLKEALADKGYSHLSIAITSNPSVLIDVNSKVPDYWKKIADLGIEIDLMTYDYNAN